MDYTVIYHVKIACVGLHVYGSNHKKEKLKKKVKARSRHASGANPGFFLGGWWGGGGAMLGNCHFNYAILRRLP